MRITPSFTLVTTVLLGMISFLSTPSLRAGDRVLFLGDSFSMGTFGKVLDQRLRESGHDVFTYVAGGASPYYWLKAYDPIPSSIGYWQKTPQSERRLGYIKAVPKVEDLMDDYDPNIVVVQTGVNLYAVLRSKRRPHDENVAEIRKVIGRMCAAIDQEEAQAYWILPPHSHERRYSLALQQELATIIREEVKKYSGAVFESQAVTKFTANYPATDGIHYGTKASKSWAEQVAKDFDIYLKLRSSHLANNPPKSVNRVEIASVGSDETSAVAPEEGSRSNLDAPDEEVELTLRLLEKSVLKDINGAPYKHALGVFEYEVLKDHDGNYPLEKVRVAHGIVFNRRFTSSARREIGAQIQLRMVPLDRYPNLQSWETVDELKPNFDMPLYTPKLD